MASLDEPSREALRLRQAGNTAELGRRAADPRPAIAAPAVRELSTMGPAALPHLATAIGHTEPGVREMAAASMARAGRADADAIPGLAKVLADPARQDPSPRVRAAAVTALGHMRAAEEWATLFDATEDADPAVRERADRALAHLLGVVQLYDPAKPEERRAAIARLRKGFADEKLRDRVLFLVGRRRVSFGKAKPEDLLDLLRKR
jgi:HEAT repeat protein